MEKKRLLKELVDEYRKKHPRSEQFFKKSLNFQIKGGSHNLRLFEPFPFYDISCKGSKVIDLDGNTYIDFWQGHFANILGHNPDIVIDALVKYFKKSGGLTTGFPGELQMELAELLLGLISADKIRFTTSGTLATMYAAMLAKAFTKRELILKVGGGWHGANPYLLKGITVYRGGLNQLESAGLSEGIASQILVTKFNHIEDLEKKFKEYGDRIACFILEPFIGAGGFIFADREYIKKACELTQQYNTLLIFDEVISGFRFFPGGVQSLYGVKPDLSIFGKAIGGGMPVSAVAGRSEILECCGPGVKLTERVKFEGGTFSAHPASMLAGITFIKYLVENKEDIYPKIGKLGDMVRRGIEEIFISHGFNVKCSGYGNSITDFSSTVGVHFLKKEMKRISSPELVWNPEFCDLELRENIFKLAMLNQGFYVFHGYGGISEAHSSEEIQASLDAVERIAKRFKKFR